MRHIRHRALQGHAASRRITDGVLLGMNGRLLMAVAHVRDVFGPGEETIVTGRNNAILMRACRYDDTPDMQAFTT